jgi:hypothetical protein
MDSVVIALSGTMADGHESAWAAAVTAAAGIGMVMAVALQSEPALLSAALLPLIAGVPLPTSY